MIKPIEPKPFTAYHEAGHAAVAMRSGISVHRLSIAQRGDVGGFTLITPLPKSLFGLRAQTLTPLQRDRLEARTRSLMAGRMAQRRFSLRTYRLVHDSSDREGIVQCLEMLSRSEREMIAYGRLLLVQTRGFINEHWDLIEALALKLLEKQTLNRLDLDQIHIAYYQKHYGVTFSLKPLQP